MKRIMKGVSSVLHSSIRILIKVDKKPMLKSKSIMERFVKAKSGGENKSIDSLKASGGGAFKHQKSTRTQNQWEKAKFLILYDEVLLSISPNPRNVLGGVGSLFSTTGSWILVS